MAGGTSLGLVMTASAVAFAPSSWQLVLPFALLWLTAPALALWASRSPPAARRLAVSAPDQPDLRLIARPPVPLFATLVTPSDHILPPATFHADPQPPVAPPPHPPPTRP